MTEEEKKARRKAQQAAAHKKWRESEKGKAYRQKVKEKRALAPNQPAAQTASAAPREGDGQ